MSAKSNGPVCAPAVFATTQWTRVLLARGDSSDAKAALGELCEAYYAPVFAFVCRNVPDEEAARDLTQGFFADLLAGRGISTVDPHRGRFRSFLLGAVKHFLTNAYHRAHCLKRGGGLEFEPLKAETDTSPGSQLMDQTTLSPDREFDRKWAIALLGRALARLAQENEAAGKSAQFEILKPWLTGEVEGHSQAEAACRLGINDGAVKVAIYRLRRRFRELVKAEIRLTLQDPSLVADELACLLQAMGSG
jgi:DNA-directed RNA polymerase specialized sigma24 family protein